MPQIHTDNFGDLEYEENSVIEFPNGIPAFEQERRFLLIQKPESAPVLFLQSLDTSSLAFITLPVDAVAPAYSLEIGEADRRLLGLEADENPTTAGLLCLTIVTIPPGGTPTANLIAPVVVNFRTRRAVQVIRSDGLYSHQYPLLPGEESC